MNALSDNLAPAFLEARRRKVLNEYTENKKIFCLEESQDSFQKGTKYSLHNSYDARNFHQVNTFLILPFTFQGKFFKNCFCIFAV